MYRARLDLPPAGRGINLSVGRRDAAWHDGSMHLLFGVRPHRRTMKGRSMLQLRFSSWINLEVIEVLRLAEAIEERVSQDWLLLMKESSQKGTQQSYGTCCGQSRPRTTQAMTSLSAAECKHGLLHGSLRTSIFLAARPGRWQLGSSAMMRGHLLSRLCSSHFEKQRQLCQVAGHC